MTNRSLAGSVAATAAALSLVAAASADTGPGASGCQPAAGQNTVALAQLLGGLGPVASVVATSQPGAIAALNHQDLFNCR